MSRLSLAFQLSASATGMSQGINAGVVELQKLGLEAKRTARDVSTLKTLEISRAFIGGLAAFSGALRNTSSLLAGFVNESVAISEAVQRSGIIFRDSAAEVQKFARSGSSIGLSEKAALLATARFGTLFETIGLAADESAEYSTRLVRLAADLASFTDTSVDDALRALSSALVGEFEPIRRYGILLNEATLKQTALQQGLRVTTGTLDPQTKLLASYAQILRQTSLQQGDFERTSGQLANQQRILSAEWANVRAVIGASLQPAYRALVKALRESLPSIRQAGAELSQFVDRIDFRAAINAAISSFRSLTAAFSIAINAISPLAGNILPAIGGYLAFINRQIIGAGIASLAGFFTASARAALGYASAAGAATVATTTLAASVRGLLIATGVGLLPVVLGAAAGALLDWAVSGRQAGADVAGAVSSAEADVKRFTEATRIASASTLELGENVKRALKVPADISINEFAEDALSEARSAIVALAKELGGLDRVPTEVSLRFREIAQFAARLDESVVKQTFGLKQVESQSRALLSTIRELTDARNKEAEAAKRAADAATQAAEQARQRTAELATEGLPAAEQARLQLNKDLLAIQREQRAAEQALADARANQDSRAVADAKARLSLIEQARDAAFEQNRERQRQALGVDENIIRPARSIADQFRNLRDAFTQRVIDPQEFQLGIRNLAEEGIRIRREIVADLSRPANRALQAADIRTQEGAAQFAALASGREDPAISQRREQLAKLDEIRRALVSINIRPVEILGG